MVESKISGNGVYEGVPWQIDPRQQAARVSIRPSEVGVFGSFSQGFVSGVMAAGLAAGAVIFSWRWAVANSNCLVKRVRITGGTDSTAFAQGSTIFDLIRATALPAQYTGGATISLVGKSGARSTRFAPSQQQVVNSAVGVVAVANTAALAAGTPAPVFDSFPMSVIVGSVGAVPLCSPVPQPGYLIDPTDTTRQPLELQNSEGFVIRATVPITGTWKFGVEVDWDEIDPARYFNL